METNARPGFGAISDFQLKLWFLFQYLVQIETLLINEGFTVDGGKIKVYNQRKLRPTESMKVCVSSLRQWRFVVSQFSAGSTSYFDFNFNVGISYRMVLSVPEETLTSLYFCIPTIKFSKH